MFYLSNRDLIKYLLIGLIVMVILYSMNPNNVNVRSNLKVTIVIIALIFIVEKYVVNSFEGMEEVELKDALIEEDEGRALDGCPNTLPSIPNQYLYDYKKEDFFKTGLEYDYNMPGYYLMNNGKYTQKGIDYSNVDKMICSSKLHDLLNQHNFNILWSPHTHIGKSRGYLNWDKIYE